LPFSIQSCSFSIVPSMSPEMDFIVLSNLKSN
jgi:hypothetical protein